MSMSGPKDTIEERAADDRAADDPADTGHSGEGAASALAHLLSRSRQQRHPSAEADDAAGRMQ